MIKRIIHFFSSLKLTIFTLILLAFTSIIGTVIQQRQNPLLYIQRFGEPLYQIFKFLGFFDVYHSWWFMGLLLILALNLLFCSIRRFPRDWKILVTQKIKLSETELQAFTSKEKITIENSTVDQTLKNVLNAMKKGGFPCKEKVKDEKGWYLFSEKGKYGRLAFYITHLSIILIFLGAIIGAAKGFKGFVNITEGEKIDSIITTSQDGKSISKKLGFEVECKKFEITYYTDEEGNPTYRPKDYKSLLSIYEQGKEEYTKEIEVNHPLVYKGIYFYQSSYGDIPTLAITVQTSEGDLVDHFKVGEKESFHFLDKNDQKIAVQVLRYLPDFIMDQNRQYATRSNIPNNPAALLQIRRSNNQTERTWVFQRIPNFPHSKSTDYKFTLTSINAKKKYTGLQVAWDPGVPVVWAGCIILILGIIIIFSVPHHRLWVTITNGGKYQTINIIGSTNKNKPSFQTIFLKFITAFKSSLADTKK